MRALMYHGIVDGRDSDDYCAANFARVGEFEEHARELARHWAVLSLAEVHDHLRAQRPLPPRAVHISFDDGYRNNLVAAEILDRHRLPWTLFPVINAVLDGYEPGYIRLAGAVSATNTTVHWNGAEFDLNTTAGKWRFARHVKRTRRTRGRSAHRGDVRRAIRRPLGDSHISAGRVRQA